MNDKYLGELTFTQALRVARRGLEKSLIYVSIAFVLFFTSSMLYYTSHKTNYYVAEMKHREKVLGYETQIERVNDEDNIKSVLMELGYGEEEIESNGMKEDIATNLVVVPYIPSSEADNGDFVPQTFSIKLNVENLKYKNYDNEKLLNGIINEYIKDYKSESLIVADPSFIKFDYTNQDYCVAVRLFTYKINSLRTYMTRITEKYTGASYFAPSSGRTIDDIRTKLSEIEFLVDCLESFATANLLLNADAKTNLFDYAASSMKKAEQKIDREKENYELAYAAYKAALEVEWDDNEDVKEEFQKIYDKMITARNSVVYAIEDHNKWLNIWTSYGGTYSVDKNGDYVYNKPNLTVNDDASLHEYAKSLVADIQEQIKNEINDYYLVVDGFNAAHVTTTLAYISKPAKLQVVYNTSTTLMLLINFGGVGMAYLISFLQAYYKMRKQGEFKININQTEEK